MTAPAPTTDATDATDATGTPAPEGTPAPAPTPAPAESTPPAPAPKADEGGEDEVAKLKEQLARATVKAAEDRDAASKKAVEKITQELGKVLGFVKDEGKAPDAEALMRQAAEQAAAAKAARIENAVIREAPKLGGDIDALLDSTTFTRALDKLDPGADDFRAQVADLIKSTVAANPKYSAAPQVPGRSGGDPSTGDTESTGQLTREQLAAMSPADRLAAVKAGRTKTLTGTR